LKSKILLYVVFATLLELLGVNSRTYGYGDFPFKLFGLPLVIPLLWILVGYLSHILYCKDGVKGVALLPLVDLFVLEPTAYYLNLWRWTTPLSLLIVPFGTVANVLIWSGLSFLGVYAFRHSFSIWGDNFR